MTRPGTGCGPRELAAPGDASVALTPIAAAASPGEKLERPQGHSSTCSLWLTPGEPCRTRYRQQIAALSERFGTPRFEPHVTLLGGLAGDPEQVESAARAVAAATAPLRLRFLGVGHQGTYFRAFFLEVEKSPELLRAHASAAARLRREPESDFLPHLSLVYGDLDPAAERALTAELDAEQETCRATRLDSVRTEGPVAEWQMLASFELG